MGPIWVEPVLDTGCKMNSSFSFIFIGSTHGFIDDFKKQKEIIENINPEFVLCENLENISLETKKNFDDVLKLKRISNMTSFEEIENLIRLCFKKNIKLIGIDLENFGFDSNLQDKIKNQEELSQEEEDLVKKIIKRREEKHIEKINEYKKKTIKPLIVIVGSWHLRSNSKLMKSFDKYKVIFPCDKEGNLVLKPSDKKISYCEKIK